MLYKKLQRAKQQRRQQQVLETEVENYQFKP